MKETWRKRDAANITVEAVRLNEDNVEAVAEWCNGELVDEIDPEHPQEMQKGINVRTPSGIARASLHMYVAQFGRHFFVSHSRPFELVYEPVNRDAPPPESAGDARKQRGFADPFDMGRMGP